MNFDDTPEEAAQRSLARQWIAANAPHELYEELRNAPLFSLELKSVDPIAAAKAWQRRKQAAGWACAHWPKDYGGRDATPLQRVIWDQEEGVFARLSQPFSIGVGMAAPTLMAYAAEDQKRELLPRIASGESVWCQLFSEPAAGSDLAGLRTRAARDGDGWRVNGQKVWTSWAHVRRLGPAAGADRSGRAQAQGPDDVLHRHAPARRRGPPHPADERQARVQRSLFHRRLGSGRPAPGPGGRRLGGVADHADE